MENFQKSSVPFVPEISFRKDITFSSPLRGSSSNTKRQSLRKALGNFVLLSPNSEEEKGPFLRQSPVALCCTENKIAQLWCVLKQRYQKFKVATLSILKVVLDHDVHLVGIPKILVLQQRTLLVKSRF